jgi:hypothetical protein
MKQDNPFAKLGALDQKLYQDTTAKPQDPLVENTGKPTPSRAPVKKANETSTNHDTVIPRHHATMQPRYHMRITPSLKSSENPSNKSAKKRQPTDSP